MASNVPSLPTGVTTVAKKRVEGWLAESSQSTIASAYGRLGVHAREILDPRTIKSHE